MSDTPVPPSPEDIANMEYQAQKGLEMPNPNIPGPPSGPPVDAQVEATTLVGEEGGGASTKVNTGKTMK